MISLKTAPIVYIALLFITVASPLEAWSREYHIRPQGSGAKSIELALSDARTHRAQFPADTIVIDLPKILEIERTILISGADSGKTEAPLIFRGPDSSDSVISGGAALTFHVVDETERKAHNIPTTTTGLLLSAVPPTPTEKKKDNIWDTPEGMPQLFAQGQRLKPSRSPKSGYLHPLHATIDSKAGSIVFRLEPSVAATLKNETGLRQAGYWRWDWAYSTGPATIQPEDTFMVPLTHYGLGPAPRYYLLNLASHLTEPNEFYYSRQDDRVYYLSSKRVSDEVVTPIVSTLVKIDSAHDIRFERVTFSYSTGPAVIISQSDAVTFQDCSIAHTGGSGIEIIGGAQNTLTRCHIFDTGGTGAKIDAGDRQTLSPGLSGLNECLIERFGQIIPTYRPGVSLMGAGNFVKNSEIRNGAHAGILFEGNDHAISGNLIHDVVLDTDDAGAVYGGRDWTARGTRIIGNAIFNVHNTIGEYKVSGVYLDDQLSGTEVSGNIFKAVDTPILLGGGRDNIITDNVFFQYKDGAVYVDSRGLKGQGTGKVYQQLHTRLNSVPFAGKAYQKYEGLKDILGVSPGAPVGNKITGNIFSGSQLLSSDEPATRKYLYVRDNQESQMPQNLAAENIATIVSRLKFSTSAKTLEQTQISMKRIEARAW